MSYNQSRVEKNDGGQLRKSGGRSGGRGFSGGRGGGLGSSGGGFHQPSISTSRSFKKSGNGQGGQTRLIPTGVSSETSAALAAPKTVQNGVRGQPPSQGSSCATAPAGSKSGDASLPETSESLPPPPQFTGTGVSGSTTVGTPVKGDGTKQFALQFGTISPGIVKGLQIPARTSSAPPNLDEQKRDQVRHDSFRAAPTQPIPSGTKQPLHPAKKDAVSVSQSTAGEAHPPNQLKKEAYQQISAASVAPIPKSVSIPIPASSVPMQFQQSPVPLQFSAPAPHQMPMTLPIGNAPQVAPPMFVHNLHSHPFQTQAMIPRGQPIGFRPQMNHHLQLENLGIGIPPSQFPQQQQQQQPGNYGGHRKTTVKITHPETHEELRLDKNATSQSQQPIASFRPQYFPHLPTNSYNPSTIFYPMSSPVTTAPQPPRFSYPIGQSGPPISIMNPSLLNPEPSRVMAPSVPTQGSVRPIVGPFVPKVGEPLVTISMPVSKTEEPKLLKLPGEVMQCGNTGSVVVGADGKKKESVQRSDSLKDHEKKSSKKDLRQSQQQTEEPVSEITTKLSSVNISKVGNGADVKKRQLSEQIDLRHEYLRPDTVTITTSLLSHDSEHIDVNSEARIGELVDVNSLPAGSISSRVGEEDQFDAPMSTGRILIKEKESSEASSTSGAEMIENISKDLDSGVGVCQADDTSSVVECRKESGGMEHGKSEELEVSLESSNAKVHLVPIITESSEEVEPVGLVKQEESGSEKLMESDKAVNIDKELPSSPHTITDYLETVVTSERTEKSGAYVIDVLKVGPSLSVTSVSKDKPPAESTKAKPITGKRKKRREILSKADAAGTSDLYNAYKGPEEKHQDVSTLESIDTSLMVNMNNANAEYVVVAIEEDDQSKGEVDDWEDAAEVSTPNLENGEQANVSEATVKKYTRDFLLTLSDRTNLPVGFMIGSDLVDALLSASPQVVDLYPSPGRTADRSPRNPRDERWMVGMMDDDRWIRQPGPSPVYDARVDLIQNFRPGQQGVNYGVLRNIRGQAPILSGPMHSLVPQGGPLRNNYDTDRWRSTNNARGLMPPPRTPMQVMHKAERKYEVAKVSDEEQKKQRQLKGILNKLTPQNFEKLFMQVKEVNIDNTITLTGVISQIFDKALMEPTFCEMYANFCFHLSGELPDFTENDEKVTFRRLLLNKCQEEFERNEEEQAEANRVEEEGEIKQSEAEREEKRLKVRRRMLGNIRLIGELYKKKMLTERIMHECINKLLGQYENPDEEDLEALCKLMSTIGDQIDHAKAKKFMDAYFDTMQRLSVNQKLSSRVRFMLRDVIDLRKNRWQQRRKVEGPKKIEEVHRDAAQERQSQASRLTRGPSMNSSSRRGQPVDYSSRGSAVLPSPNSQMGSIRGMPPQVRGLGIQDIRLEDRHPLENRMLSVPLPQRPIDDNSITLGPQGGLGRGMSIRGQPPMQSVLADSPMSHGDNHRMTYGPNGYSSRITERNLSAGRTQGSFGGSVSDTKPLSEDILREKSMSAISEFYSAQDEKEMTLCIKELNSPKFYPSMVSIWVTDSFERNDRERDLLATLLVNLCKSQDSLLNQMQLTQGFESVLSTLEDAINDAPRAAEFLGRIFVKVVLEDVVPLGDIGKIIHEGGEEPGRLLEIGLASEVLGSILEIIKTEKGDLVLNEILMSSKLQLVEFRPPHPIHSTKLDAFL